MGQHVYTVERVSSTVCDITIAEDSVREFVIARFGACVEDNADAMLRESFKQRLAHYQRFWGAGLVGTQYAYMLELLQRNSAAR